MRNFNSEILTSAPFPTATKEALKKGQDKPIALKVMPENIPQDLKGLRQWVLWRYERRGNEWAKVPINAKDSTFAHASTTDPKTWTSWEQAWAALTDPDNHDMNDGIGFVFAGTDLTGMDWDNKRLPSGSTDPSALAEVLAFNTYCEVSATGGGFHAIGRVDPQVKAKFRSKKGDYEAYNSGRYFTFTGHGGGDIAEISQRFGEWAEQRLGFDTPSKMKVELEEVAFNELEEGCDTLPVDLYTEGNDPCELRHRLDKLCRDELFAELHKGDWRKVTYSTNDVPKYPSMSEAVSAWCHKAVWYLGAKNWTTADTLFRQGKLFQDKWGNEGGKWDRVGPKVWQHAVDATEDGYKMPSEAKSELTNQLEDKVKAMLNNNTTVEPTPETEEEWFKANMWTFSNMEEVAALEKEIFIVDKLLEKGGLNILSALSYGGKTTLMGRFIANIVEGEDFMGFKSTQTPVIYFNCDRARIRRLVNNVNRHLITAEGRNDAERLFYAYQTEKIPDLLSSDFLRKTVDQTRKHYEARHGINLQPLVIVDTFRSAFLTGREDAEKGDEIDSILMSKVLKPFQKHAREDACTYKVLHHNARTTNRYAGASSIPNLTDSMWCYIREEKGTKAELTIETRDGVFNLNVQYDFATGTLIEIQGTTEQGLELIKLFGQGKSIKEVAAETNSPYKGVYDRVKPFTELKKGSYPRLEQVSEQSGRKPATYRYDNCN